MSTVTMKQKIQDRLLLRLGLQWQVGDRLPPIRELARELGTGQSNTLEAVRLLTVDGLLKSTQRAGTFVMRVPEASERPAADRDLRGKVLTMITFAPQPDSFVSKMTDAFRAEALANKAVVNHLELNINDKQYAWPVEAEAVALFNPVSRCFVRSPPRQSVVVASTSWSVVSALPEDVDAVGVNDLQGGTLAGQQVVDQPPDKVGFIGITLDWPEGHRLEVISANRLAGFESGWGQSMRQENVLAVQGHSVFSGGKAFGKYMRMSHRPKIIFAASDDLAVGFSAAASAAGLRAGHDFHIIGFDGQERGRHLVDGSLATVVVPVEEMGCRLFHLLHDRIKQPSRSTHRLQLNCSFRPGKTYTSAYKG